MRKMNWIQKKSDKKTVIIVGAVLLLLVLLIVSGVCLLRDKQDPEPTLEEIVDSKLNAYQTDLAQDQPRCCPIPAHMGKEQRDLKQHRQP